MLKFNFNDGGRSAYFKASTVGDCVTRAVAIALGRDYKEVYKEISKLIGYTPRNGVKNTDTKKVMNHYHFVWHPCMKIGTGCQVHLRENEIPMDKVIVCSVSGHLVCVKNGVINDTFDCTRDGNRCVYGYWTLS